MQSPFPGMDPFLEGHLWPDFHNSLAIFLKTQLVPKVSPKYLVQTISYTVGDTSPEKDFGIMYPDLEVLQRNQRLKEPTVAYQNSSNSPITPATITLQEKKEIEVKIPVVEIRDRKDNQLITAVEILSPVNKRVPGITAYRQKRERLHRAGVHLIEIDLLRRGKYPITHKDLPNSHYLISLTRKASWATKVWAIDIKEPLPVIPVPLKAPDEDSILDLQKAVKDVYAQSHYHLAIDYSETPVRPPFSESDQKWMRALQEKNS